MSTLVQPPPPSLAAFIECLFYMSDPGASGWSRLLPDGTVTVLFNFGEAQLAKRLDSPEQVERYRHSWVAGTRDQAALVAPTVGLELAGVTFKPAGFYPFLGIPSAEFCNRIIELDLVWGRDAELLRERVAEEAAPNGKIRIMLDALLQRANEPLCVHRGINFCVDRLRCTPNVPIEELGQHLGVTEKHLTRLFRRHVGLTPKTLAQLFRFQSVVQILENEERPDWARIASQSGYADQSHLIRAFRRFSGLTPAVYFEKKAPGGGVAVE